MKKIQTLFFTTLLAGMFLTGCQSASNAKTQKQDSAHNNPSLAWIDQTFQQKDVWQHLSQQMKMDTPVNGRVKDQIKFYQNKQRYFTDVSTRAEPYMYWLSEQIEKRNMPMELVLIPIIESAFRTDAVSSQNAAGLWQIVPKTGRNFGLKQNNLYDGRHDVVASTEAALGILERLNEMFDGDWLLTLAAYNSGEGRVMQAIAKNKKQGKATDFWSLTSLPKATQEYIPRLIALQNIFKNPDQYGIKLVKGDKSHALIPVKIDQPIELTSAANQIGINANKLKHLNAGYKKGVTAATGEHYILLPRSVEEQFVNSIENGQIAKATGSKAIENKATTNIVKQDSKQDIAPKLNNQRYIVTKGDSVSSIANKMNIKTADLKRWNNLTDKSVLNIGQNLVIQKQNNAQINSVQLAKNSQSKRKPADSNQKITHTIKEGDSLAKIAKQHNVDLADLKTWNTIKDEKRLKLGSKLTVFVDNQ